MYTSRLGLKSKVLRIGEPARFRAHTASWDVFINTNKNPTRNTTSPANSNLGRQLFGAAAFGFGLITLFGHDYRNWHQLRHILNATTGPVFLYAIAVAQMFGGAAVQFCRSVRTGAAVLGIVYLVFALLCLPRIIATPEVYDAWGNFFEQFSLVTGAAIAFANDSSARERETRNHIGRIAFGLCVASFTLEQARYLDATAALVPKWLPPSQTFWAIATTVLFGLAAVALLVNRVALLAARMLTMMIGAFGLLVWVPLLFSDPHSYGNWSESMETFAIAGAAWLLADLLAYDRRTRS